MKKKFEASIVIPTFRLENVNKLKILIDNNNFDKFEMIICINGQNSQEILSSLENLVTDGLTLLVTEITGIEHSLNIGIEAASGIYIIRVDDDDEYPSERWINSISKIKHHDADMVANSCCNIKHDRLLKKTDFIFRNPIKHPSVIIKRDILLKAGGYHGSKYAEDLDLWIRLFFSLNAKVILTDETYVTLSEEISTGSSKGSVEAYKSACGVYGSSFVRFGHLSLFIGFIISFMKIYR